jgi:hypothetical protein
VKKVNFEKSCKEYKEDDIDGQKIKISVEWNLIGYLTCTDKSGPHDFLFMELNKRIDRLRVIWWECPTSEHMKVN